MRTLINAYNQQVRMRRYDWYLKNTTGYLGITRYNNKMQRANGAKVAAFLERCKGDPL
jgi:hypothetical protein